MDIEKIKSKKSVKELLEFGIVNIDKPSGPTSFNVSDFVRKSLKEIGIRKTSHFGTLDPKVTGVLPVALNRACKLTGFFLGEDKEYIGIMRIHKEIEIEIVKKAIKEKFTGTISQLPPVKSRVKREERKRKIKRFDLLEIDGKNILFHVECEGGTYIRKLISDLGDYMKIGAHMLELRRVRAGIFKENDKNYPSINLYYFEKALEEYKNGNEMPLRKILIPGEIIKEIYPTVEVKKESLRKLLTGKPILMEELEKPVNFKEEERVAVFSEEKFIEIAKIVNKDGIFAKPEFVLQEIK